MVGPWWVQISAAAVGVAGLLMIWRPLRRLVYEARFAEARRNFHGQRERLEMKFVQLAMIHAKPGSPNWDDCQFDDDVAYVRNRSTGELSAFVAVTAAVPSTGGQSPILHRRRAATAVFRFVGRRWDTEGQAIFNVTPAEAIRLYKRDLEMIGEELASRL